MYAIKLSAQAKAQVEIEVIAKKAHIDDLTRQLKNYQQKRLDELKNDPVIAEMQKCIEPLSKEAAMKQANPQAYSPDDILRANEAVFQERVRLAERQEQFAKDDQMIKWFQWEIMQQAADLAELRILANYTDERNHLFDSSDEGRAMTARDEAMGWSKSARQGGEKPGASGLIDHRIVVRFGLCLAPRPRAVSPCQLPRVGRGG